MKRVLIIEDCAIYRKYLALSLGQLPCEFKFLSSVEEVSTLVCPTVTYDMIVCGYKLSGESGYSFLRRLKYNGVYSCPVLLITSSKSVLRHHPDLSQFVDGVLFKPSVVGPLKNYLRDSLQGQAEL